MEAAHSDSGDRHVVYRTHYDACGTDRVTKLLGLLSHYAALRARLNEHADQIAKKIDDDPCWRHPYVVTAPRLSASLFG